MSEEFMRFIRAACPVEKWNDWRCGHQGREYLRAAAKCRKKGDVSGWRDCDTLGRALIQLAEERKRNVDED